MENKHGAEDPTTLHVRRAGTGDTQSLDWVISRFTPLLLTQARYRMSKAVRRIMEPEDLVNEVWLVALKRLPTLDPRNERITPVLMKFLAVTLMQIYNNAARRAAVSGRRNEESMPVELAPKKRVGDPATFVKRAQQAEAARQVLDALKLLSPEERELIILRGIEQLPNKEAAKLLGIQPGAAAMRYARAKERLLAEVPASVVADFPA